MSREKIVRFVVYWIEQGEQRERGFSARKDAMMWLNVQEALGRTAWWREVR